MNAILSINRIQIENANAISGLTYGFPTVASFLGFTHALQRSVQKKFNEQRLVFSGCAIVCHSHQLHAHRANSYSDFRFSLTRNPLTRSGETQPFIEEGRMHMEVSLLIGCKFDLNDLDFDESGERQIGDLFENPFEKFIYEQALLHRIAGGTIRDIVGRGKRLRPVRFATFPDEPSEVHAFTTKELRCLMPGYILRDRSNLLGDHLVKCQSYNPEAELLDAWLDFSSLRFRAHRVGKEGQQDKAQWLPVSREYSGYLVPICKGYKGISPLHKAGTIRVSRDNEVPFRFVECIYGVGEWVSAHRTDIIKDLRQAMWIYHTEGDIYECCGDQS